MEKLKKYVDWLLYQSDEISFGEISIKLIVHDGSIKRIEKTFQEKILIPSPKGGGSNESNHR